VHIFPSPNNEVTNHIANFSYQTINGYSPYKSSLKNNNTGQIFNSKVQLSPNCNGQTSKEIKILSYKKHKSKPSNKEPLVFNTTLKKPKVLIGSNRSLCPPKLQKRSAENQIRPLFPMDRNRPYGHLFPLNQKNHLKNVNVYNPKPVYINKISQTSSSPIFAGQERAHRVLPSTYNPIITYPATVTYKNNLNSPFRNIPPLFNKIFLPTGVAIPSTLRGVCAHGEYATALRPYQLTPMASTMHLNYVPWCSFLPIDRYHAFA